MNWQVGQTRELKRVFTQADYDRFAQLSWDDNPIHVDPEFAAGTSFGGTLAHGMLLYGVVCDAISSLLPGPGALQRTQTLRFPNGVYVGDEISVRLEVTAVRDDGRLELATLITKPDTQGDIVTVSTGTSCVVLHMDAPGESVDPASEGETDLSVHGIELGQIAQLERVFSAADLDCYSDVTGDKNPIFRDDDAARARGLRSRMVPGPLLSGLFSTLLGTDLPGRGTGWMRQRLRFVAPAYVGEKIRAQVRVARIRAQKEIVYLSTSCRKDHGELVCDGEALVWVHNLASRSAVPAPRARENAQV